MRGSTLSLHRGLPEIRRGFVPDLSTSEVVCDQLHDVVASPGVQLLEAPTSRRVMLAAAALQHARVHHVLRQRVLEAVHQLGVFSAREDEVQAVELPQASSDLALVDREHAPEQRRSEPSADHRCALKQMF